VSSAGGLFGGQSATNSTGGPSAGGLFGAQTASTPPSSGGLFGSQSTTSVPASGSVFGGTYLSSGSSGTSLFGSGTTGSTVAIGGGSLFGDKGTTFAGTSSNSPFAFGSSNTTAPSSLFGNHPANPTTGGLFGSNAPPRPLTTSQSTSSLLGASSGSGQLYATIDQGSYSLGNSLTSSTSRQMLGPLTSPRKEVSSPSTPGSFRTSFRRAGPLKASPSTRLLLARNSPYLRPGQNNLPRSQSEFFDRTGSGSVRSLLINRRQHSNADLLAPETNFEGNTGVKKLFISRMKSMEAITGGSPTPTQVPLGTAIDEMSENEKVAEGQEKLKSFESGRDDQPTDAAPKAKEVKDSGISTPFQKKKRTFVINPVAEKEGYWISPPLKVLATYSPKQLSAVSNLITGRQGYGQIAYLQPVNLTEVSMADVLGNVVVFSRNSVCVYPGNSPKPGTGLNIPATVTLEGSFPIDKMTKQPIKDPANTKVHKHMNKLRQSIEEQGGEFITYNVDTGLCVFKVKHFSVWGLPDDYDEEDEDDDLIEVDHSDANQPVIEPIVNRVPAFVDGTLDQLGISTSDANNSGDVPQDTFMGKANGKPKPGRVWGIMESDSSDEESSDQKTTHDIPTTVLRDVSDADMDIDDMGSPIIMDASLAIVDEDTPSSWLDTLRRAGGVDSPLAFPTQGITVKSTITGSDLDQLLFGGMSSLDKSVAAQYEAAAEKMRLPDMFSLMSFARFSPGSGQLLVKKLGGFKVHKIAGKAEKTPLFGLHVKMTKFPKRPSGLSLAAPESTLTFEFLASQCKPADLQEKSLWELASLLFDSVDLPGLDDTVTPLAKERIMEQHRRRHLSKWLEGQVSNDVDYDVSRAKSDLGAIVRMLTGNRLQDAAKAAIRSKNFHLATVIPLLGSDDNGIRNDAQAQLDDWAKTKTIEHIPQDLRQVYQFMAGRATMKDVDWVRAFGLKFWYESTCRTPIANVVDSFKESFERGQVAGPTSTDGKYDIRYLLLRLYRSRLPDIASVVESTNLDYRQPWYIYTILVRSSGLFADFENKLGDQLSASFGIQLEEQGRWLEALFVLLHIHDEGAASSLIRRILAQHIDEIVVNGSLRQSIVFELSIPEWFIFEAEALKARSERDYWRESLCLIRAGLWEEAHKTIIAKVAPRAVIENKPERVLELLRKFELTDSISSWEVGGQLYMDYANLVQALRPSLKPVDEALIGRLVAALCDSLAKVKIGSNFDVRVAVSIMSAFVGKSGNVSLQCVLSDRNY
jgi:hypothetical protein